MEAPETGSEKDDNSSSNSSSPEPIVANFWKEFDLKKVKSVLEEQRRRIEENRENSLKYRKMIVENIGGSKKPGESLVLFNSMLKGYQQEVENLTERAQFGEDAFLQIYHKLRKAPDPFPFAAKETITSGPNVELENIETTLNKEQEEHVSEVKKMKTSLCEKEVDYYSIQADDWEKQKLMDNFTLLKVRLHDASVRDAAGSDMTSEELMKHLKSEELVKHIVEQQGLIEKLEEEILKAKQYETILLEAGGSKIMDELSPLIRKLEKDIFKVVMADKKYLKVAESSITKLTEKICHQQTLIQKLEKDASETSRYLEDFDELEIIGAGGSAVVAKCKHGLDGLIYAVKKVPVDRSFEKLAREVVVHAQLKHPNIVQFVTAWTEKSYQGRIHVNFDEGSIFPNEEQAKYKCLFIQMELCTKSLKVLMKEGITIGRALELFSNILAAVKFMHDKGFIHRDLSDQNVFLSEGIIKLGDFGLAKSVRGLNTGSDGAQWYKAPEMVTGADNVDHRADIYSLGVLLMEMVFPMKTDLERLHVMMGLKEEKSVLPAGFPLHISELVLSMTRRNPTDRLSTINEVISAAEEAAAAEEELKAAEEELKEAVAPTGL